jgi:dolichol-phosphate hexosyltransferase
MNRLAEPAVPISYHARSREEGKKITAWDGVEALAILIRERMRRVGKPAKARSGQ